MEWVILQAILDGNSEMDELFWKDRCEKFRQKFALYEKKMKECEAFLSNPKYAWFIANEEKKDYAERISKQFYPVL